MANEQFTETEVEKLRWLMEHFTAMQDSGEPGDGSGGDVTLEPGRKDPGGEGHDGQIVMHNPGETSRPFVTIKDGDNELDIYLGAEGPKTGPLSSTAKVGSLFIEYGNGQGGRPLRIHRRSRDGWVWAKWT